MSPGSQRRRSREQLAVYSQKTAAKGKSGQLSSRGGGGGGGVGGGRGGQGGGDGRGRGGGGEQQQQQQRQHEWDHSAPVSHRQGQQQQHHHPWGHTAPPRATGGEEKENDRAHRGAPTDRPRAPSQPRWWHGQGGLLTTRS